jgi:DNA-binding transcriptional ArsR family regulator
MAAKRDSAFHFEGFDNPTTTPVPDVVFDVLLARLKEAELKALLYIIRRTFGFKKDRDPISFNQFLRGIRTREGKILDEGCGVKDRTTLSRALKALEEMGVVISEKGMDERGENMTTVYSLRFKGLDGREDRTPNSSGQEAGGVVGNSYHRSRDSPPPVVGNPYPQETVLQQTEKQDTDLSNIRKGSRSQTENQIQDEDGESDGASPSRSRSFGTSGSFHEGEDVQRAITWAQRSQNAPKSLTAGFQSVGDVMGRLGQNNGPTGRTTRQKGHSEERQRILAYIEDFAIELGDEAPLPSSVSRAYNLYVRSGADIGTFTALMYEARALTKEYTANITKTKSGKSGPFGPQKNKMAYFFSILEHRLGLAGDEDRLGRAPE